MEILTTQHRNVEDPEASELSGFRKFVACLMSLQKQLHSNYHNDEFLRDRLQTTAVDIPAIQVTLRDRIPHTSQQADNMISKQLSDKEKSAGSPAIFLSESSDGQPEGEELYSLGSSYGVYSRRKVKHPWKKGASFQRRPEKPRHTGTNAGRRIGPHWMKGIKWCFLWGRYHVENEKHPRKEVSKSINRLKERYPKALVLVEDLAAVMQMADEDDRAVLCDKSDDAKWA